MLIELEGVTKTYGKIRALRDLSMTLPDGSIGLLGPNGAGKTTLIRSFLGLIRSTRAGRVLGMDIRRHGSTFARRWVSFPRTSVFFRV